MKTLVWLWCMWRLYREYHCDGLMFGARVRLLSEARPSIEKYRYIAHPDALFFVKPADVRRAMAAARAYRFVP